MDIINFEQSLTKRTTMLLSINVQMLISNLLLELPQNARFYKYGLHLSLTYLRVTYVNQIRVMHNLRRKSYYFDI